MGFSRVLRCSDNRLLQNPNKLYGACLEFIDKWLLRTWP